MEIKFRRKDLVKTMRRVDPVYTGLAERLGESSASVPIIALYGCLCPPRPCPHFSKEQYIRWGHVCFRCRSLFGVDCIVFTALPRETCQSQPAQINHQLSCLSCTAYRFFAPASEQQWSNALRFGRELVEWRVTGEGFESLQIGIDRNQSLVTAARGLGEL